MLMSKHILQRLAWVLCCLCLPLLCRAQDQLLPGDSTVMVLPDSSNFVTASLLIASPGKPIYSVFGHCAIRMQCPAHHLDYAYSLSTNPDASSFFRFFAGKNQAAMLDVEIKDYLSDYERDGRSVTQYELNLTHHEKQRLWQLLDEAIMRGPVYEFNMLNTNCVQMSMVMIEQALINEQFDAGQLPEKLMWDNGRLARYHARNTPWGEFIYITFIGTYDDGNEQIERKLSPETIVELMQGATFVSDGGYRRPVLKGEPQQLLPLLQQDRPSWLSPTLAFSFLLVLVLIITLVEWLRGWYLLARITDVVLFVSQTLVGLFLAYTSFVSGLLGTHWNWYLIPFCPLAIVLWLVFRKHKAISTVYLLFTITLIIFLLLTPVSSQLDLPHQLITATFAVRTASNFFASKNQKIRS